MSLSPATSLTAASDGPERCEAKTPSRTPLTRNDWVRCATNVLVDHGIDAVRVDLLAKSLKVTRGSFYWHFRDRDALLQQVLEAWREGATDQVISQFERANVDPRDLVRQLITLPFRGESAVRAASIELAIRAWARRDELARRAVDDVDARRIGYHAQCFSALGFSISEARARAFILYGYEVAESLMAGQGTDEQKAERSALIDRLICGK